MTFVFRIRFAVPEGHQIDTDQHELVLREEDSRRVSIRPLTPDTPISAARHFALTGAGYSTSDEAAVDAQKWIGALSLGFMSEFLPATFDRRSPRGGFAQGVLDAMNSGSDIALYNDGPGLKIVPEHPTPAFIGVTGAATAVKNAKGAVDAIREMYAAGISLDEEASLAIEMFSASLTLGDIDSRFLSLMIALEALIDQGKLPNSQLRTLKKLRTCLDDMGDLDGADAQQLRQALGTLKREPIGVAGRRLVSALGERSYGGWTPLELFRDCYDARSALVHGSVDRPDIELIRSLSGPLQLLIGDLVRVRVGIPLS